MSNQRVKTTKIKNFFKLIATALVLLFFLFGVLSVYNFTQANFYDNSDLVISLGGFYATIQNFRANFESETERDILNNYSSQIIKACDSDECKAKKIYDNIEENFEYEKGVDLSTVKILNDKKGDCDELSYLYVNILKANGINSFMQCGTSHCWAIIKLKNKDILADLTKYKWQEKSG